MLLSKPGFSNEELEAFSAYEDVRTSGAFNMFDSRAIEASGLSHNDYWFVMKNYTALKTAALGATNAAK